MSYLDSWKRCRTCGYCDVLSREDSQGNPWEQLVCRVQQLTTAYACPHWENGQEGEK